MNPDWDPARYAYDFPKRLVAQSPARPRDAARLLAYDRQTGKVEHATFRQLPRLLTPGSLLVLNDTRVIPARFLARKPSGGAVRVLFLREREGIIEALADRTLSPGTRIEAARGRAFDVVGRDGGTYRLAPRFTDVGAFLARHGTVPLPPYIKDTPLSPAAARRAYQSVLADRAGSAAAPTASLHFTPRLLRALADNGIRVARVTLHVGLGTFAPLSEDAVARGALHEEWYEVPAETADAVRAAKRDGRPVVAVGTTVVRALESAAQEGAVRAGAGETAIFIRPGYRFRAVDQLVTNFHVPESSLMQLVAALTGRERLLALYREAIEREYRLFSFGDGMLVR